MIKFNSILTRTTILLFLCFISKISLADTFTVTSTNATGPGTLDSAINQSNLNPTNVDTIVFALTEGQSMTINLTSSLPTITGPVFINGYSQSGSSAGTVSGRLIRININGVGLPIGTGLTSNVLNIASDNVTVAGLAIYDAPAFAIEVLPSSDFIFIWGNYIGTDSTGLTTTQGNGAGIVVNQTFSGVNTNITVGTNGDGVGDANEGNLLSGNVVHGVAFLSTTISKIAGNTIGLDKDGLGSIPNGDNGVILGVNATNNVVGTNGDGISDNLEANLIAANVTRGILIASSSDGNIVAGNTVGLNAAGAAAGNGLNGIEIRNSSFNLIGTNADGTSDNVERNIVSSNVGSGIAITSEDFFGFNAPSTDNIISGNIIGTDVSMTLVRGNTVNGVFLAAVPSVPFPNPSVTNNTVGSNNDGVNDAAEGNVITNNGRGIATNTDPSVSGNKFSRNSVYDNVLLGSDLGSDGATANDDGDADTGPNELFNVPIVQSAIVTPANFLVTGVTRPGSIVEFYITDATNEGRIFLFRAMEGGTYNGITDDSTGTQAYNDPTYGSGTDAEFGFLVSLSSLPGSLVGAVSSVTAVAIKGAFADSSTSEFGPALLTLLPVNLVEFKARLDGSKVHLTWKTTDESNNSHFEIEKSTNGTAYSKAGIIAGRGGRSNEYNFTDNGPIAKVNYYRLKQVDVNGRFAYSRVVIIRNDLGKLKAKISPNPFKNIINISYQLEKEETIQIRLYDQSGRMVRNSSVRGNIGTNSISISDVQSLATGNYTIELSGETISFKQQIIKQ